MTDSSNVYPRCIPRDKQWYLMEDHSHTRGLLCMIRRNRLRVQRPSGAAKVDPWTGLYYWLIIHRVNIPTQSTRLEGVWLYCMWLNIRQTTDCIKLHHLLPIPLTRLLELSTIEYGTQDSVEIEYWVHWRMHTPIFLPYYQLASTTEKIQ